MDQRDLNAIDPAFDLMGRFARVAKGTPALIQKMRLQAVFADGEVPAKYKVLAAALWSVAMRCEPCIKFYVRKAVEHGATEAELGEFLAVGATMGGCVGEMWALKAFKAFHDSNDGEAPAEGADPSCCR